MSPLPRLRQQGGAHDSREEPTTVGQSPQQQNGAHNSRADPMAAGVWETEADFVQSICRWDLHTVTTGSCLQPQVPYTEAVSLHIGTSVTFKGKPVQPFINEPQLQVDFHTAMDEVSDIAFHFQVYFGHYVAMNSRENGAWKQEVNSYNMPFEDGKEFELRISVLENVYQVMVNGQFSYTFDHRLPQGSVKMVQVWRDISLTSVIIQNQE
ncbi:hypothetical protein P7K49_034348 [Saguinus oedipus]|uniref:Galectin n=1 Tax=Saguinus oedipus TaxID=9490 RepID=A0ABQ9TUH0_SAGOE|nr:hypothetical protein P7K49_034348 [Saguinus oedipus]